MALRVGPFTLTKPFVTTDELNRYQADPTHGLFTDTRHNYVSCVVDQDLKAQVQALFNLASKLRSYCLQKNPSNHSHSELVFLPRIICHNAGDSQGTEIQLYQQMFVQGLTNRFAAVNTLIWAMGEVGPFVLEGHAGGTCRSINLKIALWSQPASRWAFGDYERKITAMKTLRDSFEESLVADRFIQEWVHSTMKWTALKIGACVAFSAFFSLGVSAAVPAGLALGASLVSICAALYFSCLGLELYRAASLKTT